MACCIDSLSSCITIIFKILGQSLRDCEISLITDSKTKRGESLINKPKKTKYQIIDDDMDGLFWEDDSEE